MDVNTHVNPGSECGRSPEVRVCLQGKPQMLQKGALTSPRGIQLCVCVCAYTLQIPLEELQEAQ